MRTPLWIIIIVLALLLAFTITYISLSPLMVKDIRELKADNRVLQQKVNNLSFQYETSRYANKRLRLEVADKDLDIIRLEAEGKAYGDMISILEYSLTYINMLQLRLSDMHGDYGYPKFIVRSVVRDLIMEGME